MNLMKAEPQIGNSRIRAPRLYGMRAMGHLEIWTPAVDIFEDEKAISIKVQLPEVDKNDVEIDIQDEILVISGERKLERGDKTEGYPRFERNHGSFCRSFSLPDYIDRKHIKAECEHGILRLTLPKNKQLKTDPVQLRVA